MIISEGKFKIKLLRDELVNFDDNKHGGIIKGELCCVSCGHVPMAPVKQCDECSVYYCGSNDRCLRDLKVCKNKSCKNEMAFSTSKVDKNTKEIFNSFMFKDGQNEKSTIGYKDKCKKLISDFKDE